MYSCYYIKNSSYTSYIMWACIAKNPSKKSILLPDGSYREMTDIEKKAQAQARTRERAQARYQDELKKLARYEELDPFRRFINGALGKVKLQNGKFIGVSVTKTRQCPFNNYMSYECVYISGIVGKNLRITIDMDSGGFEIYEGDLAKQYQVLTPKIITCDQFTSCITFAADTFLVNLTFF